MIAPPIPITPIERSLKKPRPFWLRLPLSKGLQRVVDISLLAGAFFLAYLLRLDFSLSSKEFMNGLIQLPLILCLQLLALRVTGIYKFIWRYVGMAEMTAFYKAALSSCLPILLTRFFLPEQVASLRRS